MKVYFSAAITRYRKLLPLYQSLVGIIEDLGHEVISKHVVDIKTTKGDWIPTYDPKSLWDREMDRLKEADALVSEITTPAFGVAFLIDEFLKMKKPLISMYYALPHQKDHLPLMLRGKPGINFQIYTEENARAVLQKFFDGIK